MSSLRKRTDALLVREKALPDSSAAAATTYTASIRLGLQANIAAENFSVEIYTEETTLNSGKVIVFKLQDSADDSSFADVTGHAAYQVTAGAASTSIADTFEIRLPDIVREYIRAAAVGEATGGDHSAADFGIRLKF